MSVKYISISEFDLRPDTLSPLINKADRNISLLIGNDIRGFSRLVDSGPDIGAYERQVGEISNK